MRTPRGRRADGTALAVATVGVLAGAAGTGAMSATAYANRLLYARRHGVDPSEIDEILDYDDSEYVIIAASTLLRGVVGRAPTTDRGRRVLFHAVHWGYGSAVGAGHVALHRFLRREPDAAVAFFVGCQAMCLTLFPVLGGTPTPWRWPRSLMVTSLVQHVLYAGITAGTAAALRRGRPGSALRLP